MGSLPMVDAAHLRELLHYDPETGAFTWRRLWGSNARPKDRPAGKRTRRYRQITIDYRAYLAHRLAFLYVTGEWPPADLEVDHINGDGFDNRFANLRLVTHSENLRAGHNRRGRAGTVIYILPRRKWRALISINGQRRFLGEFKTEGEARAAVANASANIFS
jgi:Demerecviridae HNH endonuclease